MKRALCLVAVAGLLMAQAKPAPSPEMQAMYAELFDAVGRAAKLHQELFLAQAKITELETKLVALEAKLAAP